MVAPHTNQIVMTIDLEDWFHSLDIISSNWGNYERRIEYGTKRLLNLLAKNGSTATFFALGDVAKNNPQLIKQIYKEGHEIGSHSFDHKFIYKQSREEFRVDLQRSLRLLSDLIGQKIISYRAPYFSITKNSTWALDILAEEGIMYDSSIFPIFNHRYGIPGNSRLPYKLSNGLWEWPISTYKSFLGNLPFSGGFYFRFLHSKISNYFLLSLIRAKEPVLLYFHPWELDPNQPKIKNVSPFLKFRHYHNLKNNFSKLSSVFERINTTSLSQGCKLLGSK